jgi:cell division protein FtsB
MFTVRVGTTASILHGCGALMAWRFQRVKRLVLTLSCLSLLAGTAALLTLNPRGIFQWRDLVREYDELMRKNQALEQDNRLLYQEITRLRNDPKVIEHLAREELGLAREDELIIYFAPPEEHKEGNTKQ